MHGKVFGVSMYTYYSDGFFGYGPPGTFQAYGMMHIAPILVSVGLAFLIWFKRDWLRNWKGELHLRFVLSFLMMLMEITNLWYNDNAS